MNIKNLAWEKMDGLLPAIVQDAKTNAVLMLGYMNQEALQKTIDTKWVTFFSRSKNQLWVKGETSGNKLKLVTIKPDCDQDTLLITVDPIGPTCHKGSTTCFGDVDQSTQTDWQFLQSLETTIAERQQSASEKSYTAKLFAAGVSRIAQKVGEEGVEVAMAAIEKDADGLCNEIADLWFHVLILLRARDLSMSHVVAVLKHRALFSHVKTL